MNQSNMSNMTYSGQLDPGSAGACVQEDGINKSNPYKGHPDLQDQLGAVLFFLQQLDIGMVDMLLDEGRTYQDISKADFVNILFKVRDVFHGAGDHHLERLPGGCAGKTCGINCRGYRFIGNHSGRYFDLIVEQKDGRITDLYDCRIFRTEENCSGLAAKIHLSSAQDEEYLL
jgi:hypothetical protein